jgi:pteridine reductase
LESLAGKTALITGAAKRLGRATALALAHEGVHVVVHHRASTRDADGTAEAIRSLGVKAWTLSADLACSGEADALLGQAIGVAGPIDYLINNASVFPSGRLADMQVEDLSGNLNVNALAPFLVARRFAEQHRRGSVINFLDARVVDYDKEHVAYHISKRVLLSLTSMMALEFAPDVRVNAVAPGLILPPAGEDDHYLEQLASSNPLRRHGQAEDVAEAVVFLLRSDFVTGQVLFVDGGRHLKGSTYGS